MSVKLISLDTATGTTGYSIFINGVYKESGIIETNQKIKGDEKLEQMIDLIYSLLNNEQPDIVLTELVVPVRNAQATRMLQELTGSVRGFCVGHQISYCSLRPTEWRNSIVKVTGQKPKSRKREDQKEWSLNVVNNKYNIKTESNDESDAILLGFGYIELFK